MFLYLTQTIFTIKAAAKKSVPAVAEEKSESPTPAAAKDPDELLIIESHENGVKALSDIVSPVKLHNAATSFIDKLLIDLNAVD